MSGEMGRVGQLLRGAEGKGPVRLVTGVHLTIHGSTHILADVIDTRPTPAVAAPPSPPGINSTASSGQYSWTDGTQMGTYVNEMSGTTRNLAGELNELRDDVQALRDASAANQAVIAALRSALISQGHIV